MRTMSAIVISLILTGMSVMSVAAAGPDALAPSTEQPNCTFFDATQHNLCAGFRAYWETYGGLATFGYPITEEYVEDGMTVQYFERARFEWHPGAWPERFDVLLGLLGNTYTETQGLTTTEPFTQQTDACLASANDECASFPATGHTVSGRFLAFWQAFGGLQIFGYPISQPFDEDDATVQYFERARFEYRIGSAPERYDIQLGLLGSALVGSGNGDEQPSEPEPAFTVVADGLNGPFGMTLTAGGSLLVADAGTGGDICLDLPNEEGELTETCFGETASILRISPDGTVTPAVTGLPSSASDDGAFGPSGVSSLDGETIYYVMGFGGDPADRDQLPAEIGGTLGHLFRADADGTLHNVADISAVETAENPAGGPLDSNPYAVLDLGDKRIVVDAGGNDLLEVDSEGNVSVLTTFPNRTVDVPGDLPPEFQEMLGGATTLDQEPVPDSIALGPDGFYYVGELTGGPFLPGTARVWRVDPTTGEKSVYADGFSNIISVAFGPDGSLYVLEMAKDGLLNMDAGGALTRIAPDGSRTLIASDGLLMPNAVAVSGDGDIYITNMSLIPFSAQIIKLAP